MNPIRFGLSFVITVAAAACAAPTSQNASSEQAGEQHLSSADSTSGVPQCPGGGWTKSITDWKGVHGSYLRSGPPAPTEFSQLTIFEDPNEQNEGLPAYLRTLATFLPDSGKILLGVDNPAIGPMLEFLDSDKKAKDSYFVIAQQKDASGAIRGVCLEQVSTKDNGNATNVAPFMLTKLGL
jgi:hypothetical protein